ncbi:uncharacterized protein PG998_007181 [Apiospora kogelbergensis]|uniref:uncharacterized protein n=1 Tax=Apiospora kogelbergensis TaxID=1337665 RepID=UPI003130D984
MNHQASIPFHAQHGANSALAVGGPTRRRAISRVLDRSHPTSPSQEVSHPMLASLVKDSIPLSPIESTVDGARHFNLSEGPSNDTVIDPPTGRRFRPRASNTQLQDALRRVPSNYAGNILSGENLSACIPSYENCSLFVRDLPPDLNYEKLFAALRGIGRIASAYINRPTEVHPSCAAKLVLKGEMRIGHHVPNVLWNKVRVAAQPRSPNPNGGGSRAIRVTGPPSVVNEEYILSLFAAHFYFELDGAPKLVHRDYNTATIEFIFASYVNQAENAFQLFNKDRRADDLSKGERGREHGRGHNGWGGIVGGGAHFFFEFYGAPSVARRAEDMATAEFTFAVTTK